MKDSNIERTAQGKHMRYAFYVHPLCWDTIMMSGTDRFSLSSCRPMYTPQTRTCRWSRN